MLVGTSQIDITPSPGIELCGFANRPQPSDHVVDDLFARIICLDANGKHILLINLDLIGVEWSFAQRMRSELNRNFDIPEDHIQIFATHTHSGPGTVHLNFCGEYAPDYLDFLTDKIVQGCDMALKNLESCTVAFQEGLLELGKNRRSISDHPQRTRLGIISWKKADEDLKALMVNYAMHPVCLAGKGISADYPGWVCRNMQEKLPGNPLVVFGLAAAGDIDPPRVGVSVGQMRDWGSQIADMAFASIISDGSKRILLDTSVVRMKSRSVEIPLRSLDPEEIDQYADRYLADKKWNDEFGSSFSLAVQKWRMEMKNRLLMGPYSSKKIELNCLLIGRFTLLFVNAELFSEFENLVRSEIDIPLMVISCANGLEGYLPDSKEHMLGGYEIETAIFFYNSFLPEAGSLELLVRESLELVKGMIAINN